MFLLSSTLKPLKSFAFESTVKYVEQRPPSGYKGQKMRTRQNCVILIFKAYHVSRNIGLQIHAGHTQNAGKSSSEVQTIQKKERKPCLFRMMFTHLSPNHPFSFISVCFFINGFEWTCKCRCLRHMPHCLSPLYQHDSCGCCCRSRLVMFTCLQTGGAVGCDWECSHYKHGHQ